jgi:hypothetical protein
MVCSTPVAVPGEEEDFVRFIIARKRLPISLSRLLTRQLVGEGQGVAGRHLFKVKILYYMKTTVYLITLFYLSLI